MVKKGIIIIFLIFILIRNYIPLGIKQFFTLPSVIYDFVMNDYNFSDSSLMKNKYSAFLKPYTYVSSDNSDLNIIQNSINKLDSGTIILTDSIYYINKPLIMKSNVYIRGLKPNTILINIGLSKSIRFNTCQSNYFRSVYLVDVKKKLFDESQTIIYQSNQLKGGWNNTYGYYNQVSNIISFENAISSSLNQHVIFNLNTFFIFSNIYNSGLSNLTLVFNRNVFNYDNNFTVDFLNAGILILNSNHIFLSNLSISKYPGEAISIQKSNLIYIDDIVSIKSFRGAHIGTNSSDISINKSDFSFNINDGIYFCADVKNVLLRNCLIKYNKNFGIGGLGAGNDRSNKIYNCYFSNNENGGIELYETGNAIINNTFEKNHIVKRPNHFKNIIDNNVFFNN